MTENERVRIVRTSKNMTMEKFGNCLGVTKVAISNIENGNRSVTEQMRKSICREFGIDENWLRTGEGKMELNLTKEELIAEFIGRVLRDKDDSFKKRYIAMLSKLDEDGWEALEKVANAMGQIKLD